MTEEGGRLSSRYKIGMDGSISRERMSEEREREINTDRRTRIVIGCLITIFINLKGLETHLFPVLYFVPSVRFCSLSTNFLSLSLSTIPIELIENPERKKWRAMEREGGVGHHHLRNLSHLEKKHLFMNKKCLSLSPLSIFLCQFQNILRIFTLQLRRRFSQSLNSSLSGFFLSFLFLTKRMKTDEGKTAKNSSSPGVTRLKIHADYILCNLLSHTSLTASFSSLSTLTFSHFLPLSLSLIHSILFMMYFLLLKRERVPCSQSLLILFLRSSYSLPLSHPLSLFRCYCLV